PGTYLVSTTYLALQQAPEAQQRFNALMGPIMKELAQRDGLLALSTGASIECGSVRTLSVWRDEVAMFGFVTSAAHAAAIAAIGEVSRGGSIVTHWQGDDSTVSWAAAAEHAGVDDGPLY
ncbi:MAG TPA: hypothetical protein VMF89_21850, partial [Polyangiales bacterium]|nr:hypothetical protein [Polyangiales bacterium]